MKKFLNECVYCIASFAICMVPMQVFAQPTEYTVKLAPNEVDIVGKALGKLPYEDVALLIQKLREQIVAQQSAMQLNKPVDDKNGQK